MVVEVVMRTKGKDYGQEVCDGFNVGFKVPSGLVGDLEDVHFGCSPCYRSRLVQTQFTPFPFPLHRTL